LALHFAEIRGCAVVPGTCVWGRVDDGLGRKAGAVLRVASSVMGADGEEQGIGAWQRTARDFGPRA
jgi:hypothetical protein